MTCIFFMYYIYLTFYHVLPRSFTVINLKNKDRFATLGEEIMDFVDKLISSTPKEQIIIPSFNDKYKKEHCESKLIAI